MPQTEPFTGDELHLIYLLLEDKKADCKSALQHPEPGMDLALVKYTQSVARSASRKIYKVLLRSGISPDA